MPVGNAMIGCSGCGRQGQMSQQGVEKSGSNGCRALEKKLGASRRFPCSPLHRDLGSIELGEGEAIELLVERRVLIAKDTYCNRLT